MNKEKQITKMTEDICGIQNKGMKCDVCGTGCDCHMFAEALYNIGYRKQSEGEWIYIDGDVGYDVCNCSVCGESVVFYDDERHVFCPNCGAKMKGGEE